MQNMQDAGCILFVKGPFSQVAAAVCLCLGDGLCLALDEQRNRLDSLSRGNRFKDFWNIPN